MHVDDVPLEAPAQWIEKGVPTALLSATKRQSDYDLDHDRLMRHKRTQWIERYGFAIPSRDIVQRLATMKLLEVGAGTGYWAALIKQAGGDIIATDASEPGAENLYQQTVAAWTNVEQYDAQAAITQNPERDVLMIWPCLRSDWSGHTIKAMRVGQMLIYVGEPPRGCTGTEEFHHKIARSFKPQEQHDIPTWLGIHDQVTFFRKVRL